MTKADPNSKAGQIRHAERTLRSLLRTPKTRAGLIAAVSKGHITKNFVFGWLSEHVRDGLVTELKSGSAPMYQITSAIVVEQPKVGGYPEWLEPRHVPVSISRTVYIDGTPRKGQ